VQSTAGLLTGVGAYGVAIGGLFAVAFALVHGRVGTLPPRASAVLLAAAAFVVIALVPFLKYPATPPGAAHAATIGERTTTYFGFAGLPVACGVTAVLAGRSLASRLGGWPGGLLAAGGYLAVLAVAAALLPALNRVPGDFPATTLWQFRVGSLGTQVVLWGCLGLVFGPLAERALRSPSQAGQR
jgi:hypothetical protein